MASGKPFIVQKFKLADISAQLGTTQERIIQAAINTMMYVGEQCVKQARDHGSYNDITGNLRSSIGYAVLRAGRIVHQSKPKAFKGPKGAGSQGVSEGQLALIRLAGDYPQGIVLIVTAGMEYAVYVEDIHHKDVLASSRLKAEVLVPRLLEAIGLKKKK
ncbi:MAG: hypothetical protein IJQ79_10365 [Bacteroidales bacterium]|nr:hypothetical protein [Bacteroidales bacterium]